MKTFFNKHPDLVLVAIGVLLAVGVVGLYSWGVSDITFTLNQAFNYVPPQATVGFNIQGASNLDWRGLVE